MQQKPQIVIAKSEPEKDDIYRFRHRVLVGQLGRDPAGADDETKTVREPHDDTGLHLCMTLDQKVIASVRLNLLKISPLSPELIRTYAIDKFKSFSPEAISITSQPVVAEKWAESSVPAVLLGAIYKLARRQGVRFDFCHASPALMPLYENLGYRPYTESFEDEESMSNLPLVLLTEDLEYLRDCNSPFVKMAASLPNSNKTLLWFRKTFPEYANFTPQQRMSEDEFWNFLTQKLQQTPLEAIPLLRDFVYDEAKSLVNSGRLIAAKKGEALLGAGSASGVIYILVSGAAEMRVAGEEGDGAAGCLNAIYRGDFFGAQGFLEATPKGADIVATADTEVLMLGESALSTMVSERPRIAAKLLMNMSRILCEQVRVANASRLAERAAPSEPTIEENAA